MIKISKKILVIDDDKNICEILKIYLQNENFEVYFAYDGSQGVNLAKECKPDLILLDIMLPIISGWEVCKLLRQFIKVPIIMLTAMDTIENKIEGLNIGADDYVVKPFEPKEVIARINAHLRRQEQVLDDKTNNEINYVEYDNISINMEKYEVKLNSKIIKDLKPKEVQLMFFLLANQNQVFTREVLLEKVWGYEYFGETRTVDVHIKSVREKLTSKNQKWEIKTIWNVGYKLETK